MVVDVCVTVQAVYNTGISHVFLPGSHGCHVDLHVRPSFWLHCRSSYPFFAVLPCALLTTARCYTQLNIIVPCIVYHSFWIGFAAVDTCRAVPSYSVCIPSLAVPLSLLCPPTLQQHFQYSPHILCYLHFVPQVHLASGTAVLNPHSMRTVKPPHHCDVNPAA